jgi:hypothetical protein
MAASKTVTKMNERKLMRAKLCSFAALEDA